MGTWKSFLQYQSLHLDGNKGHLECNGGHPSGQHWGGAILSMEEIKIQQTTSASVEQDSTVVKAQTEHD